MIHVFMINVKFNVLFIDNKSIFKKLTKEINSDIVCTGEQDGVHDMAKLSSTRFETLYKLFNPRNGSAVALRSDGRVLSRNLVSGSWGISAKLRDGVTAEQWLDNP